MDIEQRMLKALEFLFDFSLGSLWVVNDTLWARSISYFVHKRKNHPGLCLGKRMFCSLQDTMPMLIGTSRNSGGFMVKGFSKKNGDEYETFFKIRPIPIPVAGIIGEKPEICPNTYKPHLDPEEMVELQKYLQGKGLDL